MEKIKSLDDDEVTKIIFAGHPLLALPLFALPSLALALASLALASFALYHPCSPCPCPLALALLKTSKSRILGENGINDKTVKLAKLAKIAKMAKLAKLAESAHPPLTCQKVSYHPLSQLLSFWVDKNVISTLFLNFPFFYVCPFSLKFILAKPTAL